MKPTLLCIAGLAIGSLLAGAAEGPARVEIQRHGDGFRLLRNGTPYFIRGAVGGERLDLLAASGGNSIRTGPGGLDRAQQLGLTALVGLPIGNPRHGFDYADTNRVARQKENARQTVLKWKDHPALLIWALGNEPEIFTTPEQRIPVWRAINDIATMIHQLDDRHPVITVVGDAYRRLLGELDAQCPALDAVGLNAYVDMLTLPEDVARQGWKRPYLVSEFGPRGHWQVPKTAWRMPLEDSSTEKAAFYERAYRHAVLNRPQCLGSYAFYWANKQEKTHTWYGLFLPDGSRTAAIDTLAFLWSGHWPTNRCPDIGPAKIRVQPERPEDRLGDNVFAPGARLACTVEASDLEQDPLRIVWDLRIDVADNPNVGGDREPPSPPLARTVVSSERNQAVVQLPATPANYRLFVYVYDGQGGAATANLPLGVPPAMAR